MTHRLGEVSRLADRAVCSVTARSWQRRRRRLSERELVERSSVPSSAARVASSVVRTAPLAAVSAGAADRVTLTLHRARSSPVSLLGAGHRSVGYRCGCRQRSRRRVRLAGEPFRPRSPRGRAERRLDRIRDASFPSLETATNLALRDQPVHAPASARRERLAATRTIGDWSVVPAAPDARFSSLSGGNQQKVVLAKWMCPEPAVLVAEEPTAGIDVGARSVIYERLDAATRDGMAVLLVSSDSDEVAAIAHRAIVFEHGHLNRLTCPSSRPTGSRKCYSA